MNYLIKMSSMPSCPHCKTTCPGLTYRTNVAGKLVEARCIAHGTFYYDPYYLGYGAGAAERDLLGNEQPIGYRDECMRCSAMLRPPQRKYCDTCRDVVRLAKNRLRVVVWQRVNKERHNAKVSAWRKAHRHLSA